jgi:hypothetical protein
VFRRNTGGPPAKPPEFPTGTRGSVFSRVSKKHGRSKTPGAGGHPVHGPPLTGRGIEPRDLRSRPVEDPGCRKAPGSRAARAERPSRGGGYAILDHGRSKTPGAGRHPVHGPRARSARGGYAITGEKALMNIKILRTII